MERYFIGETITFSVSVKSANTLVNSDVITSELIRASGSRKVIAEPKQMAESEVGVYLASYETQGLDKGDYEIVVKATKNNYTTIYKKELLLE